MSSKKKRKRPTEEEMGAATAADSGDEEGPISDPVEGGRKIIFLLDKAALETTKTKRNDFELLNCDDHRHIATKNGLDPSNYRPDILHQVGRPLGHSSAFDTSNQICTI